MGSNCSICRHPDAAEINALLELGFGYRLIRDRFGLSLGTLSRHNSHRGCPANGQPPDLEQRVGRLEQDLATLRLAVGLELVLGEHSQQGFGDHIVSV